MSTCKECNGRGSVKCPRCKGSGRRDGGILSPSYECKHCDGSGRVKCGVCHGKGHI